MVNNGVISVWSSPFISIPVYQEVIKVIQPVFLGKIIQYFENYDPQNKKALYEALGYAAALSFCTLGLAVLHHLYFYYVQRVGMKIRVAMCHMIYKKVSRTTNYFACQGLWKTFLNSCPGHSLPV